MRLGGRSERRLPVAISVLLLGKDGHQVPEQVKTENVSRHGARILSKQRWQSGQRLQVAPFPDEFQDDARVIYCQPDTGDFHVGLEFRGPASKWWGDVVFADQQASEVTHAGD
jgi:PilZ domain